MDASILLSLAGIGATLATAPAHAFKLQDLEGTKSCDFAVIRVMQKSERDLYLKYNNRILYMQPRPTAKGVKNVKRYETIDGAVVYLQLPEKSMLLDHVRMTPILNDCINV